MVLGAPQIEDYFVLTSIHDPAFRATQLEAYMEAYLFILK
jgi:hypothetical protein